MRAGRLLFCWVGVLSGSAGLESPVPTEAEQMMTSVSAGHRTRINQARNNLGFHNAHEYTRDVPFFLYSGLFCLIKEILIF